MKATEILSQEHRVIEGVLDALQTAAQSAGGGAPVRPAFFIESADFIRGFADGCHHHKEEGVLFKMMVANGVPGQGGPDGLKPFQRHGALQVDLLETGVAVIGADQERFS